MGGWERRVLQAKDEISEVQKQESKKGHPLLRKSGKFIAETFGVERSEEREAENKTGGIGILYFTFELLKRGVECEVTQLSREETGSYKAQWFKWGFVASVNWTGWKD